MTGTYPHDTGRISGTVSGAKFKGRWNEAPTRKGPGDAGAVEFTMSADGKKLTGRWTYDGSPTSWHTDWTGTCTAGACLRNTSAAGGTAAPATGAVEPKVWGTDWADSARVLRGQTGTRFVFVCPAAGRKDQVWGTDIYTDNSSVCSAALHAGAIVYENGGIVTIEHLPGRGVVHRLDAERDHERRLGRVPRQLQDRRARSRAATSPGVKMGGAGWTASATRFRGQNGAKYRYICPGNAGLGSVYGTNTYTDDSSVCAAAVQLGLFTRATGGRVTIQIAPRQSSYPGTVANGVSSQPSTAGSAASRSRARRRSRPAAAAVAAAAGRRPPEAAAAPRRRPAPRPATVLVNGAPFTTGTIPFGATVDVTNGRLQLTTTTGKLTVFGAGVSANFKLVRGTDKKKAITELRLVKGDFSVCPKRKPRGAGRRRRRRSCARSGARARAASARRAATRRRPCEARSG